MWKSFKDGLSLGTYGSENGKIIKDEEYDNDARITLEKDGYTAPFSITCGIYGLFFHTAFCSNYESATKKCEEMKQDIERILVVLSDDNMSEILESFVNKY